MKRARRKSAARGLAMALTWDGARWPIRSLPPRARTFLTVKGFAATSPVEAAERCAADTVDELRICWVPRLKGGEATLAAPFAAPGGKRVAFAVARTERFGETLGVIYRRARSVASAKRSAT